MTRPQGLRRFTGPPRPPRGAPGSSPPSARPAPAPLPAREPAAPGAGGPGAAEEHCEFCAAAIPASHGHVADLEQSSLACACRACYLLFTHPGASSLSRTAGQPVAGAHGRYHAVPDRYLRDSSRVMSVAEWDELQIPVGLAFFLYRSQPGELSCFYPSPAGATECALDLPAWQRLAAAHPLLAEAEPDVEAVLICRPGSGTGEAGGTSPSGAEATMDYFIVPIDACYELAGRMRMLWRGFDGGTEARESIEEFLGQVRGRAKDVPRQDARHV